MTIERKSITIENYDYCLKIMIIDSKMIKIVLKIMQNKATNFKITESLQASLTKIEISKQS